MASPPGACQPWADMIRPTGGRRAGGGGGHRPDAARKGAAARLRRGAAGPDQVVTGRGGRGAAGPAPAPLPRRLAGMTFSGSEYPLDGGPKAVSCARAAAFGGICVRNRPARRVRPKGRRGRRTGERDVRGLRHRPGRVRGVHALSARGPSPGCRGDGPRARGGRVGAWARGRYSVLPVAGPTSRPSPKRSTRTVSPSLISPPRISLASRSPMAVCTSRRSGRAP